MPHDDLGGAVDLARPPCRVVSLVPSLTEAIATSRPELLVGATDWCTHPPGLDVPRVRGTKNPDRAAIAALGPDLVIANQEENRELDVKRLRATGLPVWVTRIESLDDAFTSLRRLFVQALYGEVPRWLTEATELWATTPAAAPRRAVAVCVWRDPWMVVGARTFTGDLLVRLGLDNVFGDHAERYPRLELSAIDGAGAGLVLLPDEPYPFTPSDGPEAFTRTPTALVSGRLLTWYGPSLLEARRELTRL